jgi:hypothetical protein
MTLKDLKDSLQAPYKLENWQNILREVLGKPIFLTKDAYQPLFQETDFVEKAFQFGSFDLPKNRKIAIVDIKLKDEKTPRIADTKVKLRELAAKLVGLTNSEGHQFVGVLAFFHSTHQKNYRLSFIARAAEYNAEIDDFVNVETANKRFTYILGESESCTTAAKQLVSLIEKAQVQTIELNDIKEAFNVDKLNKEFFKGYKEHYEKFWKYINSQPNYREKLIDNEQIIQDKAEKPIRDFAKKLLGRIVFLYFLQKKGWMGVPADRSDWQGGDPNFIKNLFQNTTDKSKFYSTNLIELFYNTLNQVRKGDIFHLTATKVPYLNGGLFDNDSIETNHFDFPESYFQDLFEFFDQFNFTIDENSPDDANVGIDPEMLGHIFENLLEENKDKGAFYTPKEIVQYMCQETLIDYLFDNLKDFRAEIDDLLRKHEVSSELMPHAKTINQLLKDVRICDPAIGSGAFPIGILQEIYNARLYLYPHLKSVESFDPVKVKRSIIQDSIYGVDKDKGAVDIARLRFWLALVVDEDIPQPLPNLDYKIMQGNSLLESFEGVIPMDIQEQDGATGIPKNTQLTIGGSLPAQQLGFGFGNEMSQSSKERLRKLQNEYYTADAQRKEALKKDIEGIVTKHIEKCIQQEQERWTKAKNKIIANLLSATNAEKSANTDGKKRDYARTIEKLEKDLEKFQKLLAEEHEREKRLEASQRKAEKDYFLWHLYFQEVFEQGGFDIFIGNPPYIQLSKLEEYEVVALEKSDYQTFARTGDIYCLFYELGNRLLKPNGTLSYITSNKWMSAAYGKPTRKYFREQTNPTLLIDFSKAVIFPAAVVFVNILNFKRAKNQKQLWAVKAEEDFQIGRTALPNYVENKGIWLDELDDDNWAVNDKLDFKISQQIDKVGKPLKDWGLSFFRGITTGLNDAFHIDATTRQILINEDTRSQELINPLLRGKDIKRWSYEYENINIIFAKHGIEIENYPAIERHLRAFYHELKPKKDASAEFGRKPGNYEWFEIQDNTAYYPEFEKEKIVWIEISDRANYCLDSGGMYLTNSAYFMTGGNLKYLLAVLNSRIMDFYFFQKTAQIAGGRKRYTKQYVELLPIPQVSDEIAKPFEKLVEYMIFLYDITKPRVNPYIENRAVGSTIEEVLNLAVIELYFADHLKQNEIDVLQFITQIPSLDQTQSPETQAATINKTFNWLQESDNQIRNRLLLAPIRSRDIISRIYSQTH